MKNYKIIGNKIGGGSFGDVFKAKNIKTNKFVAIKIINLSRLEEDEKQSMLAESYHLLELFSDDMPYIIKLENSFRVDNFLYIVTEFCEKGDLGSLINMPYQKPLSENEIWKYFIEVCIALHFLHNKNIIHRDLKPQNIFLTNDFHVRLGDFGISKTLKQADSFTQTKVGTPYYLPPEIVKSEPYNIKCDIWSLGVCLYELVTRSMPFNAKTIQMLEYNIKNCPYSPLPLYTSNELKEIIDRCLKKNYKERPYIHDILLMKSVRDWAKKLNIKIPTEENLKAELPKFDYIKNAIVNIIADNLNISPGKKIIHSMNPAKLGLEAKYQEERKKNFTDHGIHSFIPKEHKIIPVIEEKKHINPKPEKSPTNLIKKYNKELIDLYKVCESQKDLETLEQYNKIIGKPHPEIIIPDTTNERLKIMLFLYKEIQKAENSK